MKCSRVNNLSMVIPVKMSHGCVKEFFVERGNDPVQREKTTQTNKTAKRVDSKVILALLALVALVFLGGFWYQKTQASNATKAKENSASIAKVNSQRKASSLSQK